MGIPSPTKYAIYRTVAQWNQANLDHENGTSFSRMYKENPGISGARQDAINWWEEYVRKPYGFRVTDGPSLEEIGYELLSLECRFVEMESWCLDWFSHYTFNIHLSDKELIITLKIHIFI